MTDVLIRGVPVDDLRRLDERAAKAGLSRNEYLKRQIAQEVSNEEPRRKVTMADLNRHTELVADLADEEVMRQAWR